jgi:hypothetical protein
VVQARAVAQAERQRFLHAKRNPLTEHRLALNGLFDNNGS